MLHGRHSINVNARRWHTMQIVTPFTAATPGGYDTLSGEVYLDTTYLAKSILPNMDLRASGFNLFNNTDAVGMAINNGVYHPRGRSVGFQFTARF